MGTEHNHLGSRWKLASALLMVILLWLVVFPAIGRLPAVRNHIEPLQNRRIHPDAMFYTELDH